MKFKEDKYIELKEIINNTFLKTVSAFANFETGSIYFGVRDDGKVIGIENVSDAKLSIENKINDTLKPVPNYEIIKHTINGKNVIELKVYAGKDTPYRYKEKSYRRGNTSTVVVDDFMLKKLLLKGMNLRFEQLPYTDTNLEFTVLEKMLKEVIGIEKLSKDVLKSLGLYKNDSFNNAAALLADNNDIGACGIDIVRFGETESIFLDRVTEDRVSLLTQYKVALDFFDKWYSPYEEVVGFYREKRIHLPREAYREAVSNLLCHRQFMINAKAKIACYEDRIEIVSVGGLPEGITEEEYLNGLVSNLRNETVADVFHRLDIIEKFATGIKRIKNEYKKYAQKPIFEIRSASITVILPCIVYDKKKVNRKKISQTESLILNILKENGVMTRNEIEKELKLKKRSSRYILKKLINENIVIKLGSGKNTKYSLPF